LLQRLPAVNNGFDSATANLSCHADVSEHSHRSARLGAETGLRLLALVQSGRLWICADLLGIVQVWEVLMTAMKLPIQLLALPLVAFLWPGVTALRGADEATLSPISLRFSPTILALSPDSTLAVGAGAFDPMGGMRGQTKTTPVAVVDLKKQAVICDKSLPLDIGPAAIDSQFVYAASQSSDVLYVLGHKDLSQVRRVFTNGRINGLACVDNRLLFIRSNTLSVLKVPSLEPATEAQVGLGIHEFGKDRSPMIALPVRLGEGWWFDGVYYDQHFQNALVLVQPHGFWQCAGDLSASPRFMPMNDSIPSWLHPWGTTVDFQGIHHGTRLVGQFRQMFGNVNADVLPEQPAAVSLHQEGNNFNEPHRRSELLFQDLVNGLTPFQIVLINEQEQTSRQLQPFGPGNPLKMEVRPGLIVCQIHDQLFAVPAPKLDPKLFPAPMHFERREKIFFLGSTDVKLPLPKLVAGDGPVEFSLSPEVPGVEIDKQGTFLSLNADALRAKAQETAGFQRPAGQLDMYLRNVGPVFERLAGRKPKQVPVWARLHVVARDKSLQTAELDYGIGLEVPMDRATADSPRWQAASGPANSYAPREQSSQSALERRLANIERRLDDISRQLDKLTRSLDKKHDANDPNK
jgi:hypothetical protein